jgi:hypothetical protein
MVCGTHTRKSRRAVPGRDKCGRERIERHYRGKEEGRPWLVGQEEVEMALSAGTLEEGLVLNSAGDGAPHAAFVTGTFLLGYRAPAFQG